MGLGGKCDVRYVQDCATIIYLVFKEIPCQFNMNGLVGVNALVWVAVALAVLINEAAALGGAVGGGRAVDRRK
ncbi:hypothetical protein MTO96_038610 [Rhipicephalus appendiculatus]